LFGSRRAGQTLLSALSGEDEQNRVLAGMSLVKAGQRSLDLIEETIEAGGASVSAVRLLPDIGGPKVRAVLSKIAANEPGEVTDTARECVALLDRIDALEADDN